VVIWIAFSLGSRIGFCLAVTGLFGVVFQNLFCFCWFRSCHYTIIIFWYLAIVWVIFITFTFVCFSISSSPNKSQICNLESKSVFFLFKLYYCLCLLLLLLLLPYLCHVFTKGEGTEKDCWSTMRKTKPWFGGFSVEDYSMIFKLHGKRRYSAKRMKDRGEPLWLSFKIMYASG